MFTANKHSVFFQAAINSLFLPIVVFSLHFPLFLFATLHLCSLLLTILFSLCLSSCLLAFPPLSFLCLAPNIALCYLTEEVKYSAASDSGHHASPTWEISPPIMSKLNLCFLKLSVVFSLGTRWVANSKFMQGVFKNYFFIYFVLRTQSFEIIKSNVSCSRL